MKIIDISTPLHSQMLIYDGDPLFQLKPITTTDPDAPDSYNISSIFLGSHCGTHLDPPLHFGERGKSQPTDQMDLEILCGPAQVIDVSTKGPEIGVAELKDYNLEHTVRLLLKTNSQNSTSKIQENHTHLTLDGAIYLKKFTQIGLIGIDTLSIEDHNSTTFPVHRNLLLNAPPVYILEGLNLEHVKPGTYDLFCLPLKIVDGDGGPARAILVETRS